MPTPAKLLSVIGLLAKPETTYGSAIALTTTADGVQMQYKSRDTATVFSIDYAFDGDLGPSVATFGTIARVSPSGRSVKGDIPTRARPGGAAYSATVIPSIHNLLKAAGFNATITTSAGTESVAYALTPPGTTYASLTAGLYSRGQLMTAAGVLCNAKFDAPDPAPPIWTFGAMGIVSALPTDVAAPTITYPLQTVPPPLGSSVTPTFGSFTTNAVVRSSAFDLQRKLSPRVAQSGGGGHLGFVPDDVAPICKITLEATSLVTTPFTSSSGFDPYQLRDTAQSFAFALKYGSAQYFRYTLNMPQAQVIDVTESGDGPTATVDLTIAGFNSTASTLDCVNILFD